MKFLIVFVLLELFVKESFGTSCVTCKGSDCVGLKQRSECNRNIPKLPFNADYEVDTNSVNTEYACLDLTYAQDNTPTRLRQCVLVESGKPFCDELALSTALKTYRCRTTPVDVPDDDLPEDDPTDDGEEDTTDESSTTEDEDTTTDSTTPDSSTTTDNPTIAPEPSGAPPLVPLAILLVAFEFVLTRLL